MAIASASVRMLRIRVSYNNAKINMIRRQMVPSFSEILRHEPTGEFIRRAVIFVIPEISYLEEGEYVLVRVRQCLCWYVL